MRPAAHIASWRGEETKDNATLFISAPVAGFDSAFDLAVFEVWPEGIFTNFKPQMTSVS